jgi:SAM-dependent methyltransferase
MTQPHPISWQQFVTWARQENQYQKQIAGVHGADHPHALLRGRTYFEVNLYRYFHALNVCWPYLDRPGQKIMDVGSWPGAWMRLIAHFAAPHQPRAWASGLMFPDQFLEKMGGACAGMLRCELDPYSPMRDTSAPTTLAEKDFTFVSAMEVVEHLYHPKGMFQVIADAMAPGGILFLTTNNVGRLANLFTLLTGGGLVGNLQELIPRDGGILGNWRPHAREYAWRELEAIAQSTGFVPISHGFYQENYGLRLIEGIDQPSEQLTFPASAEKRLARELRPLLKEPNQLKSGMYLLFEKQSRAVPRVAADTIELVSG